MSALSTRKITWNWADGTRDKADILRSEDGLYIRGHHGGVHYWVFADGMFQTQWIKVWQAGSGQELIQLHLLRETGGWRHKEGAHIVASHGTIDSDIGCTVATHTLTLKRLDLAFGEIAEIDVLSIPAGPFEPRIERHRYMRHRGGYDFENLQSGARARLSVDAEAWVTDYPGVCQMEGAP